MNSKNIKTPSGKIAIDFSGPTKTITYNSKARSEFFSKFSSIIGVFMELTKQEMKLFSYLLNEVNEGRELKINTVIRSTIATDIGATDSSVANSLGRLVRCGLIKNTSRMYYHIPEEFCYPEFSGASLQLNIS